jgi:hypothetical protein
MVLVPVTEDPDWHVRLCLGNALPYKVGCDLSVCWTTALDSMLVHLFIQVWPLGEWAAGVLAMCRPLHSLVLALCPVCRLRLTSCDGCGACVD